MARTRISSADLDAVIGAADSLAGLDSLDELRRRAVEIVRELVRSTMVAWNEVDLAGRQIDAVISPPLEQVTAQSRETLGRTFIEHVLDHPVIAHYQRTRDGRPYAISDFLTAPAFHQTGIYRDFYRYLGAEDQLSFVLPDPALVIGIALNRPRRGFSARDRQVCNLLRPQLLQAYRMVEARTRLTRLVSTLENAAAEQGHGFIRLDGDHRILEASVAARGVLHRFFAHHSDPSLPDEIAQWVARDRDRQTPAELAVYRPDGHSLIVHRAPGPSGDLLLLSEQPRGEIEPHKLGLTAREAEVLGLVREGLATKRIASALAISPRTVDKHVQHAIDKLGVRTRVQAIALLAQLKS